VLMLAILGRGSIGAYAFFVQQYNLISRLKNNLGIRNQQIFSQDRTLEFYATAKAHAGCTIGFYEFESIGALNLVPK
jgi:hypothetical protein